MSANIHISGLNTEPAPSPSAASDFRYRFCLCGRLPTSRLHFSRVGLTLYVRLFSQCRSKLRRGTIFRPHIPNAEASLAGGIKAFTHWVTIPNFTGLCPIPKAWIYPGTITVGLYFFIEISAIYKIRDYIHKTTLLTLNNKCHCQQIHFHSIYFALPLMRF